jgi:hypothetical protein
MLWTFSQIIESSNPPNRSHVGIDQAFKMRQQHSVLRFQMCISLLPWYEEAAVGQCVDCPSWKVTLAEATRLVHDA